jgi:hypothetical protein
VLVAVAVGAGLHLVSWPQVAVAKDGGELSTCLNLATGVTRVLARGSCDPVSEMAHGWSAVAADEPLGRVFSARTLAQAVVLNTGGDTRKFTKRDWAAIAALDAANRADSARSGDAGTGAGSVAAAGAQEVRSVVTTCVNDVTGVARIIVSGGCEGRSESRRRWVSVEPLQMPSIADGAPGIPEVTGVRSVGADGRAVSFEAPVDSGSSPITSMTVIAIPGGQSVTIRGGAGGTALFTGLAPGTKYTFRVVAVNASGAGPRVPSQVPAPGPERRPDPAPSPTPTAAPTVAPVPTAAPGGGGSSKAVQSIAFSNPGSQNYGTTPTLVATSTSGLAVSVASSTGGVCTVAGSGALAFLSAGTCTITADQAGNGAFAAAAQVIVSFTVAAVAPGAPTVSAATAGSAQASVAFTAPSSSGGFAITSYTVTSSPGGFTGTGASSPVVVTGLANGTSYTFTVTATNSAGTGSSSGSSGSATPATVPGAPTVGAASVVSGTSASVAFTAPSSSGGSAITSYTVTSSPGGFTGSGVSSPVVVTGLANGTSYTFTVTATNSAGTSAASAASGTATPAYALGTIGPGGGLIFSISGGRTYEMAPNTWNGGASDPLLMWCNVSSVPTSATGANVGDGAANTVAIKAACGSGAGNSAGAYAGGGMTDWFLPARYELSAMSSFSRSTPSGGSPYVPAGSPYEFTSSVYYWTSTSGASGSNATCNIMSSGSETGCSKSTSYRVRPIRSW